MSEDDPCVGLQSEQIRKQLFMANARFHVHNIPPWNVNMRWELLFGQ